VSLDPAPPITFDLAELVGLEPAGGELRLALQTGCLLQLSGMGKSSAELVASLSKARRDRTAYVFRFGRQISAQWEDGDIVAPGESSARRAGLRLFGSLVGIVPDRGEPLAIPLGDIRAVSFDETTYQVVVETTSGRWCIGRLGRRSVPFVEELKRTRQEFGMQYHAKLKDVMPHLAAHRLQQLSGEWLEGVAVPAESLDEAAPGTRSRFLEFLPSAERKLFVKQLTAGFGQSLRFGWYCSAENSEDSAYSFEPFVLFQKSVPGGVAAAWEDLGEMGTATYIFRGTEPDLAERLNAALRAICFAREPIYLSQAELVTKGEHRHYVPLLDRSGDLKFLRARFAGRVLHVEPETYATRLAELCGESGSEQLNLESSPRQG
jgi:hypothetical protein